MKTEADHVLDCIQEECAEVIQIISKIKRFGIDDVWQNKEKNPEGHSNRVRFGIELNDLYGSAELLEEVSGIDTAPDLTLMDDKKKRIRRYMEYSREKGLLLPTQPPPKLPTDLPDSTGLTYPASDLAHPGPNGSDTGSSDFGSGSESDSSTSSTSADPQ